MIIFFIDKSYITVDNYKSKEPPVRLIYNDFNNDGKKDITYVDGADNGQIIHKNLFIRNINDNKFIQKNFYEFDNYMNNIVNNLKH